MWFSSQRIKIFIAVPFGYGIARSLNCNNGGGGGWLVSHLLWGGGRWVLLHRKIFYAQSSKFEVKPFTWSRCFLFCPEKQYWVWQTESRTSCAPSKFSGKPVGKCKQEVSSNVVTVQLLSCWDVKKDRWIVDILSISFNTDKSLSSNFTACTAYRRLQLHCPRNPQPLRWFFVCLSTKLSFAGKLSHEVTLQTNCETQIHSQEDFNKHYCCLSKNGFFLLRFGSVCLQEIFLKSVVLFKVKEQGLDW